MISEFIKFCTNLILRFFNEIMSSENITKVSKFIPQSFENIYNLNGTEVNNKRISASVIKGKTDGIVRFCLQGQCRNKFYTPESNAPEFLIDKKRTICLKAQNFEELADQVN